MPALAVSLTAEALSRFRQRRAAGERVKTLAEELGIPWQRLDKALRHGSPETTASEPVPARPSEPETAVLGVPAISGPGLLSDKYRPVRLANLFGQPHVVRHLQAFAADPYPVAFLFSGETGTGKTSAALALATELGCDLDQREFGGVHVIASGEQSAEAVRECFQRMWLQAPCGSGWKVFILNEAERMHVQAETIWLDRLESIPPKTVIVFTTNHPQKISQRFRDRCMSLHFDSDAGLLRESAHLLLTRIWRAETGRSADLQIIDHVITAATVAGQLSFRRAVQFLQPHLTGKEQSHGNGRSNGTRVRALGRRVRSAKGDPARRRAKRRVLGH
jgi:hypothetical protein